MIIMMMLEQMMKTWRIHQWLLIVTAKGKCSWLMLYINNCSQKIMQDVQHEPCFCWRSWHSSLLVQPPWRPRSRNKVLYSLFSVVQTYEIYKKDEFKPYYSLLWIHCSRPIWSQVQLRAEDGKRTPWGPGTVYLAQGMFDICTVHGTRIAILVVNVNVVVLLWCCCVTRYIG